MKTKLPTPQTFISILLLFVVGTVFSACKGTPKVDWPSRVGNFTYDQAVAELGPPDKSTKLSDGKMVADWVERRRGGVSFGVGTGFSSGHTGVGVGQSISSGHPDKVLRLTFGADNRLLTWSKNY